MPKKLDRKKRVSVQKSGRKKPVSEPKPVPRSRTTFKTLRKGQ